MSSETKINLQERFTGAEGQLLKVQDDLSIRAEDFTLSEIKPMIKIKADSDATVKISYLNNTIDITDDYIYNDPSDSLDDGVSTWYYDEITQLNLPVTVTVDGVSQTKPIISVQLYLFDFTGDTPIVTTWQLSANYHSRLRQLTINGSSVAIPESGYTQQLNANTSIGITVDRDSSNPAVIYYNNVEVSREENNTAASYTFSLSTNTNIKIQDQFINFNVLINSNDIPGDKIAISELNVGDKVKIYNNGQYKTFVIAHKGNPDSSQYGNNANGVWLIQLDSDKFENGDMIPPYHGNASTIDVWLNETYINQFDSNFLPYINEIRVPYYGSYSDTTQTPTSSIDKIVLPSLKELGMTAVGLQDVGNTLDYFQPSIAYDHIKLLFNQVSSFNNKIDTRSADIEGQSRYYIDTSNTTPQLRSGTADNIYVAPMFVINNSTLFNNDQDIPYFEHIIDPSEEIIQDLSKLSYFHLSCIDRTSVPYTNPYLDTEMLKEYPVYYLFCNQGYYNTRTDCEGSAIYRYESGLKRLTLLNNYYAGYNPTPSSSSIETKLKSLTIVPVGGTNYEFRPANQLDNIGSIVALGFDVSDYLNLDVLFSRTFKCCAYDYGYERTDLVALGENQLTNFIPSIIIAGGMNSSLDHTNAHDYAIIKLNTLNNSQPTPRQLDTSDCQIIKNHNGNGTSNLVFTYSDIHNRDWLGNTPCLVLNESEDQINSNYRTAIITAFDLN